MAYTIPTDWKPDAASRLFAAGVAAEGHVDIEHQMTRFRAYSFKEPVRDPDKVWLSWLRKAVGFGANGNGRHEDTPKAKPRTETERSLAVIEAFRQASPSESTRLEKFMAQHKWWNTSTRGYQVEQLRQAIMQKDSIFEYLERNKREF